MQIVFERQSSQSIYSVDSTPNTNIILTFQATCLISVQYLYWVSTSLVSEIRRSVSIFQPTQAELQNVRQLAGWGKMPVLGIFAQPV